jgi:hypothetical protein
MESEAVAATLSATAMLPTASGAVGGAGGAPRRHSTSSASSAAALTAARDAAAATMAALTKDKPSPPLAPAPSSAAGGPLIPSSDSKQLPPAAVAVGAAAGSGGVGPYETDFAAMTLDEVTSRFAWSAQWHWGCDEGLVANAANAGNAGNAKSASAVLDEKGLELAPARGGAGANAGAGAGASARLPISTALMEDFVNGLTYMLSVTHAATPTHALALHAIHRVEARATEDLIPEILLSTSLLLDNLYDR